jgi:hypothetical protein
MLRAAWHGDFIRTIHTNAFLFNVIKRLHGPEYDSVGMASLTMAEGFTILVVLRTVVGQICALSEWTRLRTRCLSD